MVRRALQEAIDTGQTERWTKERLVPLLQQKGWWGPTVQVDRLMEQAATLGAALGARVVDETLRDTAVLNAVAEDFRGWAQKWYAALDAGDVRLVSEARTVGAMTPDVVSALKDLGIEPETAVLTVHDRDIVHAHSAHKRGELARE